jgi:hypothetical protein
MMLSSLRGPAALKGCRPSAAPFGVRRPAGAHAPASRRPLEVVAAKKKGGKGGAGGAPSGGGGGKYKSPGDVKEGSAYKEVRGG